MRDSSSAAIRISEAAVASFVQRNCRSARTASRTTRPESIRGQKVTRALSGRLGESARPDGLLFKNANPRSEHARPGNRRNAAAPRAYKHTFIMRMVCETGERFCGRIIVTLWATDVFSYAMFWLSRTGERVVV